jgi:hypothetical protein
MKGFAALSVTLFVTASVFGTMDYVQARNEGLLKKLYIEKEAEPVKPTIDNVEFEDYSRAGIPPPASEPVANKKKIKNSIAKQKTIKQKPKKPIAKKKNAEKLQIALEAKSFSRAPLYMRKEELVLEEEK